MRPVITPEESARLDAAATLPVDVLMERAGYAVARWAATLGVGYGSRIVVLAGRGNNGGDGYVAARHLRRRGAEVVVRALGAPKRPAARRAAALAEAAGVRIEPLGVPDGEWELLVDAAFGVGFRGGLPPELVPWTELGGPVLAVDVPSGLDAATGEVVDAAFSAELTVTFHALKTGHLLGEGPDRSGRVEVVDIGLDGERPEFLLCEEADAPRPTRPRTAHKWSAGSVLVVGGSPGMVGAPVLVADAALRAGAGAVAIACPEGLQPIYETMRPGLLTVAVAPGDRFGADAGSVLGRASRYDVLVVGPGLGTVAREFVVRLLSGWPGPVVVDADALNALVRADALHRVPPTVITPHAGEFRRLAGVAASPWAARELAAETGAVVLLKGNPTFVAGRETWVVTTGGPELATIGTGDVLAGMVGAFLAAGLPGEVAARSAAYHHGLAGRRLARRRTVTAVDLVDEVGRRGYSS